MGMAWNLRNLLLPLSLCISANVLAKGEEPPHTSDKLLYDKEGALWAKDQAATEQQVRPLPFADVVDLQVSGDGSAGLIRSESGFHFWFPLAAEFWANTCVSGL